MYVWYDGPLFKRMRHCVNLEEHREVRTQENDLARTCLARETVLSRPLQSDGQYRKLRKQATSKVIRRPHKTWLFANSNAFPLMILALNNRALLLWTCRHASIYTVHTKKTCPKSRVLLSSFAASTYYVCTLRSCANYC